LDFESKAPVEQVSDPVFVENADYLIGKLQKLSKKKISQLMKLSDNLSELNVQRYKAWNSKENLKNTKQAAYAFTGDVYRGMDVTTFNKKEVKYAQNHVRILSGLYGLLKPLDLIQPYRLEMGTRLKITPKTTNLYKFWDNKITDQVNEEMETLNTSILLNLASNEYFKSIHPKHLKGDIITCQFKDFKNGEYKMIMTFAKQARGMMAAYVVKNRVETVEELKGFNTGGYGFDANLSTETELVFTR